MQNFREERTWRKIVGFLFKSCRTIRLKRTQVCTHTHAHIRTRKRKKKRRKIQTSGYRGLTAHEFLITPPPKHWNDKRNIKININRYPCWEDGRMYQQLPGQLGIWGWCRGAGIRFIIKPNILDWKTTPHNPKRESQKGNFASTAPTHTLPAILLSAGNCGSLGGAVILDTLSQTRERKQRLRAACQGLYHHHEGGNPREELFWPLSTHFAKPPPHSGRPHHCQTSGEPCSRQHGWRAQSVGIAWTGVLIPCHRCHPEKPLL